MDFDKINIKFYNLLCGVFSDYYIWLNIREYFNNKSDTSNFMDERYKEFFVPILFAFQDKFMLGLANLLDGVKTSKDKKVISIFELLEFISDEEKKRNIINSFGEFEIHKNKLKRWRNKSIAHKDYNLGIKGYDEFIEINHLQFDDIFSMMIRLGEMYDNIYNCIYENNRKHTDFSGLNNNMGFQRLTTDIKYFVPTNDDIRIGLISKKLDEKFKKNEIKNIE